MKTLPDDVAALRAVALLNVSPDRFAEVLVDHGETDLAGFNDELYDVVAVVNELRALFAVADRDDAAARLNLLLARHGTVPQLVRHEGWDWHLHADRIEDTWANWLAASAALALATRLVSRPGVPWGTCTATECRRVFLDDGHGGGRRFCSSTCATRERVRRHRTSRETRRSPG